VNIIIEDRCDATPDTKVVVHNNKEDDGDRQTPTDVEMQE